MYAPVPHTENHHQDLMETRLRVEEALSEEGSNITWKGGVKGRNLTRGPVLVTEKLDVLRHGDLRTV